MNSKKIKSRREIAAICQKLKKQGKTIGFTSGNFDILHSGHSVYLEKAKQKCDVLVVAVNSDTSVKKYKGPDRPIIPEDYRIELISALESVDYCFLFDERRNAKNIEAIKPDFYIKAADYNKKTLTSGEIVEKYGGKVTLIDLEEGLSATKIIEKILKVFGKHETVVEKENAVYLERKSLKSIPAVFLDRDGVINEEIDYVHELEKFKLLPNVIEGLTELQNMGFALPIVTHQAGIGLGYFTKEDFFKFNKKMLGELSPHGIKIPKIYFCPHPRTDDCDCRKPGTALIKQAKKDLNIDLTKSYFIGDSTKDIEAGRRAGLKTILVKTGNKGKDGLYDVKPDFIAKDLLDAATIIKKQERK